MWKVTGAYATGSCCKEQGDVERPRDLWGRHLSLNTFCSFLHWREKMANLC